MNGEDRVMLALLASLVWVMFCLGCFMLAIASVVAS